MIFIIKKGEIVGMDLPMTCFDDVKWYINHLLEVCKIVIYDDQAKRMVRWWWSSEKPSEDLTNNGHLKVAQEDLDQNEDIEDIEELTIKMETKGWRSRVIRGTGMIVKIYLYISLV